MDIQDYPELKEALAALINVHHDSLEDFFVCHLPPMDRETLRMAYIHDADVEEIKSAINGDQIAKEIKRGIVTGIAIQDALFEKINKIAKLMGPTLREIERSNNQKDRIDE